MPASAKTIENVARILATEIGVIKAREIVIRIHTEVDGNKSFEATIRALGNYLNQRSTPHWNETRNQ